MRLCYCAAPLADEALALHDDGPWPITVPGPLGHTVLSGLHAMVAALTAVGHTVIVDHLHIERA